MSVKQTKCNLDLKVDIVKEIEIYHLNVTCRKQKLDPACRLCRNYLARIQMWHFLYPLSCQDRLCSVCNQEEETKGSLPVDIAAIKNVTVDTFAFPLLLFFQLSTTKCFHNLTERQTDNILYVVHSCSCLIYRSSIAQNSS